MHAALFDQICEAFDINVLEVEDFCTPLILLLNMRFVDIMLILFEVSYFIDWNIQFMFEKFELVQISPTNQSGSICFPNEDKNSN